MNPYQRRKIIAAAKLAKHYLSIESGHNAAGAPCFCSTEWRSTLFVGFELVILINQKISDCNWLTSNDNYQGTDLLLIKCSLFVQLGRSERVFVFRWTLQWPTCSGVVCFKLRPLFEPTKVAALCQIVRIKTLILVVSSRSQSIIMNLLCSLDDAVQYVILSSLRITAHRHRTCRGE